MAMTSLRVVDGTTDVLRDLVGAAPGGRALIVGRLIRPWSRIVPLVPWSEAQARRPIIECAINRYP